MATASRFLFPQLPPELRNEVYDYLSTQETNSTASLVGLPLKLKTYECKHTIVQIFTVHYGSTGLLALQSYQFEEGREYSSWLLNNAVELRIGITFKGRVNTFVQQDWDKKMEAHLKKLAKLHPWLRKVAKYDIQILWDPVDWVLKSKQNKKVAGQIPRDMTTTLTALMRDDVKNKRGDIAVKLRITRGVAVGTELKKTRFGFAEFLSNPDLDKKSFKSEAKEIRLEPYFKGPLPEPGCLILPVPSANMKEGDLLVVEKGLVKWTGSTKGHRILRKNRIAGEETVERSQAWICKEIRPYHYAYLLFEECLGPR
ncbi:hypothetical protein CC86DRAFT_69045 [Ophiobolus disseminans]|uniref:Uncharacterized protein n=1 Tax=Ophiobolus disseminans TaxID=1469910 RepID=A0A6A6ZQY7_9PLEO|nr:hypothetical protein CC86DRAFT_69045 [Ophiobolus disseminans]